MHSSGANMLSAKRCRYIVFRIFILSFCVALPNPTFAADDRSDSSCWVGTWASSPQLAEPKGAPAELALPGVTLRQFVHVSAGGRRIRVRFSNAFGTTPLLISTARVAISAGGSAVKSGTEKELAFNGQKGASIPAGALIVSDPLDFDLRALSDVAITTELRSPQSAITAHLGSRTTSYILTGNPARTSDMSQAVKVDHWYYINGVDVASQICAGAIAILGDSITDGRGSTTNGNDRWPDVLARRVEAAPENHAIGVLNLGIGGNRLLRDGLGPNALARLDRDALAQAGIRWLVVLEGVNDIGTRLKARENNESWATAEDIIGAFEQIIMRAHTHGISVFGATMLPFGGSFYFSPDTEADRQRVNRWILTRGAFDGVVDFDNIIHDPQHPDRLLPAFDSGDHLHPSPLGYAAMADAVPLSWFGISQKKQDAKLRMAITFDDLPARCYSPW